MKINLLDRDGHKCAEVETDKGPFSFELSTVSGPKVYKLSVVYKRQEDGTKDLTKIKGAMLQ